MNRWYLLPEGVDPRDPIEDDDSGGAVALTQEGVTPVVSLNGYFIGEPTFGAGDEDA